MEEIWVAKDNLNPTIPGPPWIKHLPEYEGLWKGVWEAIERDPELKSCWYYGCLEGG
ncbi:hypothetical protein FKP32DRAFT_1591277 [Trametes sanguinea]|nr:hypothetical protein FKP32DRAFT_1591277 [Trametes sanguinea]